ncbi:hypothetical protein [Amycolatopsis iheyensis]|nr:hypothetical protein [Amycolatopsis iheyensis]
MTGLLGGLIVPVFAAVAGWMGVGGYKIGGVAAAASTSGPAE